MSYSYDRFLRPVTSTDRNIQIMNNNGTIDYTINPFSVLNIFVDNNLLKINLKSNRVIVIPFSSQNESKLAIVELQDQIDELIGKTPIKRGAKELLSKSEITTMEISGPKEFLTKWNLKIIK